jgi:hypothetical protein
MIRSDPGILLGALEVAKLRKSTREKINAALLSSRHEDLLYGMILAEGRLVSVIRPRRHSLHPPGISLPTLTRHATVILDDFQQYILFEWE